MSLRATPARSAPPTAASLTTASPTAASLTAARLAAARRAAPALGLAGALLLVGCGSGQRAEVYQEHTVADATYDSVGAIAVQDLAVPAPRQGLLLPQGSNAPMIVTFINEGGDDDVLTSASSPAATSVRIVGPSSSVPVPRLGTASSGYSLELVGLTRDLQPGTYIDLTLVFSRNGSKTLKVPVQTTPGGAPRPTSTYQEPGTDSAGSPLPTPAA